MADVVVTNDVDTFLKSADNAAARTNLEVYSDAEVDAKVATKAVAGGVAWTTGTAAGNAAIDFGTADFSLSGVVALSDYTPSAAITFFKSHSTGNNTVQLQLQTDGDWRLIFTDNGGTAANYDLVPSALTNGNAYQFVVTADRDGNAQLYIDGATSGSAVLISAESAVDIGSGNTNAYQIASVRNDFRIFNRALSAAEVGDLYESGTVAVADRWGTTEGGVYTSDFSVNEDGWLGTSNGTVAQVSSGGFDWLEYTQTTNLSKVYFRKVTKFITRPKEIVKLTATVKNDTSRSIYFSFGQAGYFQPIQGSLTEIPANTTADISIVRINNSDEYTFSDIRIESRTSSNLADTSMLTNEKVLFRNIEVTSLGCIADLPLDEGIGYQFHDRSSNHFDALASTTGVTHLVPKTEGYIRDFNVDAYNGGSGDVQLVDSSRDILVNNVILISAEVHNKTTGTGISSNTIDIVRNNRTFDDFSLSTVHATVNSDAAVYIPLSGAQQFDLDNRKNIKISSSDADATDLDIRVDYKIIE